MENYSRSAPNVLFQGALEGDRLSPVKELLERVRALDPLRRLLGSPHAADAFEVVDEALASKYPTHPLKDPARLGMALVDADRSLSGNTLATLQLMGDKLVPTTMNADRYRILARVGADEGSEDDVTDEAEDPRQHGHRADHGAGAQEARRRRRDPPGGTDDCGERKRDAQAQLSRRKAPARGRAAAAASCLQCSAEPPAARHLASADAAAS